jgi:low affinity Fe/Cu permease
MKDLFRKFSSRTAEITGSAGAFGVAILLILAWLATGPLFHYADTWQLVINTGTTIVTFLMVFLIQNTQNRDAKAIHLKLDELIRSHKGARNTMIDLEDLSEDDLKRIAEEFAALRAKDKTLHKSLNTVEALIHQHTGKKVTGSTAKRASQNEEPKNGSDQAID